MPKVRICLPLIILWIRVNTVWLLSLGETNTLISSNEVLNQHITECITYIAKTYFVLDRTLVFSQISKPSFPNSTALHKLHSIGRWPIVITSDEREKEHFPKSTEINHDKHFSYIIYLQQCGEGNAVTQNLNKLLKFLKSITSRNSKARYLLVITCEGEIKKKKILYDILKNTSLGKMNDIVVLIPFASGKNASIIEAYTWYTAQLPIEYCGSLDEISLIDSSISNQNENGICHFKTNLYRQKATKKYQGCTLRASTINFPPYITLENGSVADGLDVVLMNTLAKTMNVTLRYNLYYGKERKGRLLPNGSWTGLREHLHSDKADFIFGAFLNNYFDYVTFDISTSYYSDDFTWLVKHSETFPRWLGATRVFTLSTWILHFSVIFLTGCTAFFISNFSIFQRSESWNLSKCILAAWAAFLGTGMPPVPSNTVLRVLLMAWIIFSFATNTVFQAFFTSYQINPGYEHQISDVEELYKSKIIYAFSNPLDKFLEPNILEKLTPRIRCEAVSCIRLVATMKKDSADLTGRDIVNYHREQLRKQENGHELYMFREKMFQLNFVLFMQRDSLFLNQVNEFIVRVVEGGLPVHWMKSIMEKKKIEANMLGLHTLGDDYVDLQMSHLQGAFIFLVIGIAFSILSFIVEIIMVRIRNRIS